MANNPLGENDLKNLLAQYTRNEVLRPRWTKHALLRMQERGITFSEVRHLLTSHFDLKLPVEEATGDDKGLFKYTISCPSLMRKGRRFGATIIPLPEKPIVKIITVMWEDVR